MDRIYNYISSDRFILGAVFLFIVILRFIPISFGDIYGDSALNSFRAYGWLDWFSKGGQSTPFEWLGMIPDWAKLSFHDAPPLAFLIQNIFFNFFGGEAAIARLPFVLAGISSVLILFLFLKKITNLRVTFIATILYSFISFGVWAGQAAYLEGMAEFFIVGSVLFGAFYLFKNQSNKYLYIWSIFMACALLTKYTALFLLPPIIIYSFFYRDLALKNWKNIISAIALFFLFITPVIIYNLKMYQLRGHPDAAISSFIGMHPSDFGAISQRKVSLNIFDNFENIFYTLRTNISPPLLLFSSISFLVLLWELRKRGFHNFEAWTLCNLVFLLVFFSFGATATRFLSVIVPFIVIITALGIDLIFKNIKNIALKNIFGGIMVFVFLFELIYSINTNVLKKPFGRPNWFYSENKIQNFGFNQLDDFIRNKVIIDLPNKNLIKTKDDISFTGDDIEGRSVVIYDDRINWFAQMWYGQRYLLYYRWPIMSSSYFPSARKNMNEIKEFLQISGKPMYFVYPIDSQVMDIARDHDNNINYIGPDIARQLDNISVPFEIIKNESDIPVFKIYKITNL